MASRSSVQLARVALGILGVDSNIESLNENRAEAGTVSVFIDEARRQVLSSYDWGFARQTQVLSQSASTPISDWGYAYDTPAGMLVARAIINPYGRKEDVPETQIQVFNNRKTILTDIEQASLIYTADVEDYDLYTAPAYMALAHLIAAYTGPSLIGDRARGLRLFEIYTQIVKQAAAVDSNQDVPHDTQVPDWISKR